MCDKDVNQKLQDSLKRSIAIYSRVIGKKASVEGANNTSITLRDKVANFFARESTEVRSMRSHLKAYRHKLQVEQQNVVKANNKHRKRVADQFTEFKKQEKQLCNWGLKFAVPAFRMQAWVRLSRSALLEEISSELQTVMSERLRDAAAFSSRFEECPNKLETFSIPQVEEYCRIPELLLETEASLAAKSKRLLRLDIQCNLTTKKFRQFEPDFAWKDQAARKDVLLDILQRYKQLPSVEALSGVESDLTWKQFCDWLATRNQQLAQLEAEFSDFVEDQREKEGRLFFRWCTAMLRGQQDALVEEVDVTKRGSFTDTPSKTPESGAESFFGLNHLGLDDDATNSPALPGNTQATQSPPMTAPGAGVPQGIVSLKMTPSSVKAFIQYFANDVIGVQYGIPRDCLVANGALTEALFYRRIHPFVLRYSRPERREMDERWRVQSQLCRFVDPLTYHVPANYLYSDSHPSPRSSKRNAKPAEPSTGHPSPGAVVAVADGRRLLDLDFAAEGTGCEAAASTNQALSGPEVAAVVSGAAAIVNVAPPRDKQSRQPTVAESANVANLKTASKLPDERLGTAEGASERMHPGTKSKRCHCHNCATFSYSKRLQRLADFSGGQYGSAYARAARVLSLIATAVTPKEIMLYLALAYKWLLRDAIDVSGSRSTIGADLLVPLFTVVVITAQVPHIHLVLDFLVQYGVFDEQGDISYNIANLEGSVLFVLDQLAVPEEVRDRFERTDLSSSIASSVASSTRKHVSSPVRHPDEVLHGALVKRGDAVRDQPDTPSDQGHGPHTTPLKGKEAGGGGGSQRKGSRSADVSVDEDYRAMAQLGEWLRDQQTMEDTITILQKDGWMA